MYCRIDFVKFVGILKFLKSIVINKWIGSDDNNLNNLVYDAVAVVL